MRAFFFYDRLQTFIYIFSFIQKYTMPRRCKRRLIYPVNNTWVTPFLNTQKNIQAHKCLYKKDNLTIR